MNEQAEKLEYIIPRRIRQGYEFSPGWRVKQVIVLLSGLVAGVLWWLLAHMLARLLHIPIVLQIFPAVIVAGVCVIVAMPQPDGSTLLERVENWRVWSKRQKLYLYDWSRDDY